MIGHRMRSPDRRNEWLLHFKITILAVEASNDPTDRFSSPAVSRDMDAKKDKTHTTKGQFTLIHVEQRITLPQELRRTHGSTAKQASRSRSFLEQNLRYPAH